jgi:hypothetical protein
MVRNSAPCKGATAISGGTEATRKLASPWGNKLERRPDSCRASDASSRNGVSPVPRHAKFLQEITKATPADRCSNCFVDGVLWSVCANSCILVIRNLASPWDDAATPAARDLVLPWEQNRKRGRFPELVFWVPRTEGY